MEQRNVEASIARHMKQCEEWCFFCLNDSNAIERVREREREE